MEKCGNSADEDKPETVLVSTPAGDFRGCILNSFCGLPFVGFRGIPYAQPPVGKLRFSRPEPMPPLQAEYDATKEGGPISLQPVGVEMKQGKHQEDCLYLNVFTPIIKDVKGDKDNILMLKKVMVFIHGGGFFMGCANQHVPGDLVAQGDVIVVTFNYRLSWLGFVKGPTDDIQGNMGLWDQLEALRWVHKNIRAFGGDPDDVTLSGQSMGGESVSAFSLIKEAKHLFTRGILMSGSMFGNKSTVGSSDGLLDKLIDKTGIVRDGKTYVELVEELRNLPEEKFVLPLQNEITNQFTTIDGELFPESFPDMINNKDYLGDTGFYDRDYLVTLTNNEGQLISTGPFAIIDSDDKDKDKVNLPERLGQSEQFHQRLMDWYRQDGHHTVAPVNDMMADQVLLLPSFDFLSMDQAKKRNSFFLLFDHWPSYCPSRLDTAGMVHGLDLCYLFDITPDEIYRTYNGQTTSKGFTEEDERLKRLYIDIVVDFMHHGNANSSLAHQLVGNWPPFESTNEFYLKLGPKPVVDSFPFKERRNLWRNIVPNWKEGGNT